MTVRFGSKLIWMAATLLIGTPVSAQISQTTGVGSANEQSDQVKIIAWAAKWQNAFEAGDVNQLREMYEPDAVLMANGAPPQKGVNAILAFLGRNKAAGNAVTIDFQNEEIVVDGAQAYLTAKYWMTITLAKGSTFNVNGRSFLVFRKGADGQWRLWRDIDNQAPDVLAEDRPVG